MNTPVSIFWFRRDLRLEDNAGLYHALKVGAPVLPLFIFDRDILERLSDRKDARVTFIHTAIEALKGQLENLGSSLLVRFGTPQEVFAGLMQEYAVKSVFTNRDYEPYAQKRDADVASLLAAQGATFHTFKDHVIFEKDEVVKEDGTPYVVFTPYSRKWLARLDQQHRTLIDANGQNEVQSFYLMAYPTQKYFGRFFKTTPMPGITLETIGFEPTDIPFPPVSIARSVVMNYDKTRNFPALNGTSKLGIHFRFGTISIREKARHARQLNATYLNELIWRDFYSQILGHYPHVVGNAFRPQYDTIEWRDAPEDFEKWCQGRTGYPIVDAGMRELLATGFMHNRVRMIVASFLTKHLLIDWRLGEAWFAEKLLDFDLASNSGGWQWAAGCGTDAAPYFRIFNPAEQTKKFDKDYTYIRKWVPEFGTPKYPRPVVEHTFARERCLATYKKALNSSF